MKLLRVERGAREKVFLTTETGPLIGEVITYFGKRLFEPGGESWLSVEILEELLLILNDAQ